MSRLDGKKWMDACRRQIDSHPPSSSYALSLRVSGLGLVDIAVDHGVVGLLLSRLFLIASKDVSKFARLATQQRKPS